jgi:hypothetical protein
VRCIKRSLLQARLGVLSDQQNESHLKAETDVATQMTVENESPKHSAIGDTTKTRYRRKSKRGEGKVKYRLARGYQEEESRG